MHTIKNQTKQYIYLHKQYEYNKKSTTKKKNATYIYIYTYKNKSDRIGSDRISGRIWNPLFLWFRLQRGWILLREYLVSLPRLDTVPIRVSTAVGFGSSCANVDPITSIESGSKMGQCLLLCPKWSKYRGIFSCTPPWYIHVFVILGLVSWVSELFLLKNSSLINILIFFRK